VALVTVASIAGCGSRNEPDPFVGTWRQLDYRTMWSAPLIIARVQDGYLATLAFSQTQPQFPLTREGNDLVGTVKLGMGRVRVEVAYVPKSGHLAVRNAKSPGGPMSKPVEMTKVSNSTVIPSRSP